MEVNHDEKKGDVAPSAVVCKGINHRVHFRNVVYLDRDSGIKY
jgi:hypothetical protein